ncbi:MAG: acetyl-CoA carboxylase biotin carboxylase subunit [Deltaproteobacteria bacterium]|nr:acetyl-CoA carboxylase biotin carboxylase subunit [Deltaproteobacteria bacterium]
MARSLPFKKILIANRGEIAVRVMRSCREMGIKSVAVYSEPDRSALHTLYATEAIPIGPAPSRESYLRIDRIIDAAKKSGADAIHPGYGFLSEKAEFARACADAGIVFIGPSAHAIETMGEKTLARRTVKAAGVPVVPGTETPVASLEEARRAAEQVGFPIMMKAAAGGGGKGMRLVRRPDELQGAYETAQREALNAFGDGSVYLERFLEDPRHIEIQVFGDGFGRIIHLNERECSIQRRNQKVIEESPSPFMTDELRARMGEVAVKAASAVSYSGAGTIEFLVDKNRNFYFLEMNTRLQVEHPVTELTTGYDLVRQQIIVAAGEPLGLIAPVEPRGHAIEARIYAEDPSRDFMPSPGTLSHLRQPGGFGVRIDAGVYAGSEVTPHYDPLIAKLAVWGRHREAALGRLDRALSEYVVNGVTTNVTFLRRIARHPAFIAGETDTAFIARHMSEKTEPTAEAVHVSIIAAAIRQFEYERELADRIVTGLDVGPSLSTWRMIGRRDQLLRRMM